MMQELDAEWYCDSAAVVSGVQVQDVLQGVGIVTDGGAGIGLSGGWV